MSDRFESLTIEAHLVKKLHDNGIAEPTPIQAEAIPLILEGKDVVARSQTGTGKTLAYALPIVQKADPAVKKLQALIVVPTQELGMQIYQVLEQLTAGTGLLVQTLIGGASLQRQIDKLKLHPHIAVGTPGRLLELIKQRKLSLHNVRTIVVDEVDQVFDLGAMNEVEAIFKSALRDRQLLFFSATLPDTLQAVVDRWMREPQYVQAGPADKAAGTLEHLFVVTEERDKVDTVRRVVRMLNPKSAIVFTNEIDKLAEVLAKLQYVGLSVEALYGEAGKQERERVMKGFRAGRFQLLLATDVAARGLDIPEVTHVINLDLPIDADHYVHRAGRTGRMGRSGTVISVSTTRERFIIDKFAKTLHIPLVQKELYAGKFVDPSPKKPGAAGDKENRRPSADLATVHGHQAKDSQGRSPVNSHADTDKAGSGLDGAGKQRAEQEGAAKQAPEADRRPAAKQGAPEPKRPGAPSPQARANAQQTKGSAKSKNDRERDRKNKGAPRWLKEKSSPDRTP